MDEREEGMATMDKEPAFYQHSGSIGILGPLFMFGLGLPGAVLLGAVYGYAIHYIPLIYLNFVLTIGLSVVVGILVGMTARLGKVRSVGYSSLIGLVIGAVTLFASWSAWIHAFTEQEILPYSVSAVWSIAKSIAEVGPWSILGYTPTGFVLYALWLIEAVVIVGGASLVTAGMIGSVPFCEPCSCWLDHEEVIEPLSPLSQPDETRDQVIAGDLTPLHALTPVSGQATTFTRIALRQCPNCRNLSVFSLSTIQRKFDEKGKAEDSTNEIVVSLLISQEVHDDLADRWEASDDAEEMAATSP